ncbi:MAG: penicillin acylase family protein, partial [Alphaproteobacteria bacterium]|nr:penicillin acylase family protein [Alphaproteobacteria bacterium]
IDQQYGYEINNISWGHTHYLKATNFILDKIPFLNQYISKNIPTDGDNETISRGTFTYSVDIDNFEHIHGSGLRTIMDLSNLKNSLFMISSGQSGNFFSPNYYDLSFLWANGHYTTLDNPAKYTLELVPN